MGASPQDRVVLRSLAAGAGEFDAYTSCHVTQSILRPFEAGFELGDNGSYSELREIVAPGAGFERAINGRPRMRGQVVMRTSPLTAQQSSVLQCVFRTKLSDMNIGAADTKIRVKNASLKDIIEKAVAPFGITPAMIQYRANVARDAMTGKPTAGGRAPKDLEPLQEKQANVQPGETTYAFLVRHLRRHGLMIWDSPDGGIVISAPDDEQDAIYFFRCFRGTEGAANNCLRIERIEDVSGAPTSLFAFGYGGGQDFQRAKVSAGKTNTALIRAGFAEPGDQLVGHRPVIITEEGIRTRELAQRVVAREFSERIRRQDAWAIEVDGLAFRERAGDDAPYAIDTCCDAVADTLGGATGRFYVEEVIGRVSPAEGCRSFLQAVVAGTWAL